MEGCISVPIINDEILESNEQFFIILQSSETDVMINENTTCVSIIDDDGEDCFKLSSGAIFFFKNFQI